MVAVSLCPGVIASVKSSADSNLGSIDTTVELADLKDIEEQVKEEKHHPRDGACSPAPGAESHDQVHAAGNHRG